MIRSFQFGPLYRTRVVLHKGPRPCQLHTFAVSDSVLGAACQIASTPWCYCWLSDTSIVYDKHTDNSLLSIVIIDDDFKQFCKQTNRHGKKKTCFCWNYAHKKALIESPEVRNCVFAYLLPACLVISKKIFFTCFIKFQPPFIIVLRDVNFFVHIHWIDNAEKHTFCCFWPRL